MIDKNIAVYKLHIRGIQNYKYQHYDRKYIVGAANLDSSSRKIDIVVYSDNRYIHKQIEIKNNLLFMRIKKRSIR